MTHPTLAGDAGVMRPAEPRELTQAIAAWLYDQTAPDSTPLAGVQFTSRHGDGLALWAALERPGDDGMSALLQEPQSEPVDRELPPLALALPALLLDRHRGRAGAGRRRA